MKICSSLVIAAIAAMLGAPALAHTKVFAAPLNGISETPPNSSTATGNVRVTIDLDLFTMRVEASFSGLSGNVTAAHIHCCTAVAGTGNVGVATMLPTFTGFPSGVMAGTYDQTFDMSLASSYNQNVTSPPSAPGFLQANGGSPATAFNTLLAGLEAGKAYLNVHTAAFPGGEIRGLLVPVPEPETYALMLAGLGVLGWTARRKPLRA